MYAVFLQATQGSSIAQIIMTPATPAFTERTFFRFTMSGARGRSARWEEISGREAEILRPVLGRDLDVPPVVVRMTDGDFQQIAERGAPTTLGTKAIAAAAKSGRLLGGLTVQQVIFDNELRSVVDRQDIEALNTFWAAAPTAPVGMPEAVTTTTPSGVVREPEPAMRMASIPDASIAKAYVHRKVYGQDDFEIFAKARARKENVLLKGPTGAAKTMSALAYAASEGLPTFTISGSVNFEASEAIGQMMLDPVNGLPYFQYGGAIEVIKNGGVLILDEINFIPSKVITPFFPLLDDRREVVLKQNRGEIIKAHPDLLIVATMNPGYLGTQAMNFALANRFDHHLEWGYEEGVEKKLVPCKSLRDFAAMLRANPAVGTPVPTNALMSILSNTQEFSLDYALSNFLARFDEAERKAVGYVLDSQRRNIEIDLGIAVDAVVEQDEIAPGISTDTQTWVDTLVGATQPTVIPVATNANGHPFPPITHAHNAYNPF